MRKHLSRIAKVPGVLSLINEQQLSDSDMSLQNDIGGFELVPLFCFPIRATESVGKT